MKFNFSFKNKLFKETFWSFATKGITLILFLALNIFLARYLGVEKFGLWSFFFSILTVIFLLSYFGINASARKYVAQYNKTIDLRSVLASSFKLRLVFSLVFTIILLIFHKQIAILIGKPELATLFLLSSPLVFLSGFIEYLKDIFMGLHRIKYNFIVNTFEYGLKLILVVAFLVFSNELISIINSYIIASLITVIVGIYILYLVFYRDLEKSSKDYTKEIFNYSIPLFFISIGFIVATEIDTIMLGLFRTTYDVGIYSIAKQIIVKLPHISLAIAMGIMPIFAKLNKDNKEKLKKIFFRLLKINTLIFGLIILAILSTAWFFIPLIFGEQYSESVLPLILLLPYLLIFSYSIYLSSFLDYRGKAYKRAMNLIVAIVLNIILNLILIPKYGPIGAAIGTSLAYIPYLLLNWIEVRKIFN